MSIDRLRKFIGHKNVAELLDEDVLGKIGQRVYNGYDIDKQSRSDWESQMDEAFKLAKQLREPKNFPFEDSANVKYPLVTVGAVQFNSRATAAVMQDGKVVKSKVTGADPEGKKGQRADRVSTYVNWQLSDGMEDWEEGMDKLLITLPIVGDCFKKTMPDPITSQASSRMVSAKRLVINMWAHSVELAPRITEEFDLYEHEIFERQSSGQWLDVDLPMSDESFEREDGSQINDDDKPHAFLEQHCRLDLDEDGYAEPYAVIIHSGSQKVLRIVPRYGKGDVHIKIDNDYMTLLDAELLIAQNVNALAKMNPPQFVDENAALEELLSSATLCRIKPVHYYTRYQFIPSPDGSFYSMGLGMLLLPINESVNTVVNQLLDAGKLANLQSGFIGRGVKIKKGPMRLKMGEFTQVDSGGMSLKENIVPMPFPGPSTTLFSLLQFLVEAGKDISSVKDVMLGDLPAGDVPATTTLAAIEQGMKVFAGIYKRIHRALKKEVQKIIRINSEILTDAEYQRVVDDKEATVSDFDSGDADIQPVSDPTIVSETQKLLKAEVLKQWVNDPLVNQGEIRKRYFEATDTPNIKALLEVPPQAPDPKMIQAESNAKRDMARVQIEMQESAAKIMEMKTKAALNLAKVKEIAGNMKTPDDVKEAVKKGELSREQGINILKSVFKMDD